MRVRAERIEELVRALDEIADAHAQSVARELVQSVTELHAEGLERTLEVLSNFGPPGAEIIDSLGEDDLVGPLMALHGLHPLALRERVARAVDRFGTEAELLGVEEGNVRIRLRGHSHGCGSAGGSARASLEDAIYNAAPDLESLSIEEASPMSSFVPLDALRVGSAI